MPDYGFLVHGTWTRNDSTPSRNRLNQLVQSWKASTKMASPLLDAVRRQAPSVPHEPPQGHDHTPVTCQKRVQPWKSSATAEHLHVRRSVVLLSMIGKKAHNSSRSLCPSCEMECPSCEMECGSAAAPRARRVFASSPLRVRPGHAEAWQSRVV